MHDDEEGWERRKKIKQRIVAVLASLHNYVIDSEKKIGLRHGSAVDSTVWKRVRKRSKNKRVAVR